MSEIKVLEADRKNGRVKLSWEAYEVVLAMSVVGKMRVLSKVQINKDRLYEQIWIPTGIMAKMYKISGAILRDYAKQARERLVASLRQ